MITIVFFVLVLSYHKQDFLKEKFSFLDSFFVFLNRNIGIIGVFGIVVGIAFMMPSLDKILLIFENLFSLSLIRAIFQIIGVASIIVFHCCIIVFSLLAAKDFIKNHIGNQKWFENILDKLDKLLIQYGDYLVPLSIAAMLGQSFASRF